METGFIICLGLIIGSFLNVVIYRLPRGKSIVTPRSFCPHCLKIIHFYDNFPVVSFILLRGKCRHCHKKISFCYPLIELLTAFGFWLAYQYWPEISVHLVFIFIFLCLLVLLGMIDLKHMILPDELTLGGAVLFFIYSFFNPEITAANAFLSAAAASFFFAAIYFFYIKVRKFEGLGFGDVKMMLLLGAFLGFQRLIVALLISSVAGMMVGLFFIIFRKKNFKFALPFGTFLSFGSYISFFLGYKILALFNLLIF